MATEAATGPSLSSLPPEIILHIIRLASARDSVERRSVLCSFALVDPTWRLLAQQELLRHILVPARPTDGPLEAVKRGGADRVKSILSVERHPAKTTQELLKRCKSCLELDLDVNLWDYEDPLSAFYSGFQIHEMKELRKLHLRGGNGLPSPPQISVFGHLRRLSLALVRTAEESEVDWQYINPSALPALTVFNLVLHNPDGANLHLPGLRDALHSIAPQLRSILLATDDAVSILPLRHLGAAAIQLESLYLDTRPEDVTLVGASLNHTLRSLELGGYMLTEGQLATHLRTWCGTSGPKLERLVLPSYGEDADWPRIEQWCTTQEVSLVKSNNARVWNENFLIDWDPL